MTKEIHVLVGNLGRDPEMRYSPSGQAVTQLNVACERRWKDQQGKVHKVTTWHRVSVWGKRGEVCNQYLRKGSKVLVECRQNLDPQTGASRIWIDKDGQPRTSNEWTATNVTFLVGGKSNDAPIEEPQFDDAPPPDDDIPF